MILLTTALHWEAKPFISAFGLKKDLSVRAFELFTNGEIELIVTGIGKLNAATATTYLLTRHEGKDCVIGNIGLAGAAQAEVSSLHLINKVTNCASRTSYYPDQLLRVSCQESPLETHDLAVTEQDQLSEKNALVDMEGAAFAHAASRFVDSSAYFLIKVVSDNLVCGALNAEYTSQLLIPHISAVLLYGRSLLLLNTDKPTTVLSENEKKLLTQIIKTLRLTHAETEIFTNTAASYKVRKGNLLLVLSPITSVLIESPEHAKKIYHETRATLAA